MLKAEQFRCAEAARLTVAETQARTLRYPERLFVRSRNQPLTIKLYGIKNCDTMKKARSWLDSHGVQYEFHDYKTVGIDPATLARWCREVGWEKLLNRAGATFRKLPESQRAGVDERKAKGLMLAQPSMIKRPVLDLGKRLLVGFEPEIYEQAVRERA
jgi:arsenate reductase (glutaredoxin)